MHVVSGASWKLNHRNRVCVYIYSFYQEQAPLSCKLLLFLFHIVKRMLLAAIGVAPGPNDLDSKPLSED